MKKIIIGLLSLAFFLVPATGWAEGLGFMKYDEAMKRAVEEKKPVMLFFWASWCGYCVKMRQEVFTDAKVQEVFAKSFVGVSVNIEDDPEKINDRFKAKALPTMAFIRPDGEVLGVLPGFIETKTFIDVLNLVTEEMNKQNK